MRIKSDLTTLKQAKKLFIETGKINRRVVSDEVSYSWYRSKVLEINHKGVDFNKESRITTRDIEIAKLLKSENHQVISYNKLYNIYLLNSEGQITEVLSKTFEYLHFNSNSFSDQVVGTNGIANTLKTNEASVVFSHEHYVNGLDEFFTYGEPIYDDDEVICYLGIVGYMDDYDEHTINTVSSMISSPSEIEVTSKTEIIDFDLPKFYYGKSRLGEQLYQEASKIACTTMDFLIRGSAGNGKELLAREIHKNSNFSNYPFVPLNPKTMIENVFEEKFHKSLMMPCTIYIENVECISSKIETEIIKYYDTKFKSKQNDVDLSARIIYSTCLRENLGPSKHLFYHQFSKRILDNELIIPDWSERKDDFRIIIKKIFQSYLPKHIFKVSEGLISMVEEDYLNTSYREVCKAILLIVNNTKETELLTVNSYIPKMKHTSDLQLKTLSDIEKEHISSVLHFCDNNMLQASKILGIGRSTLYRKVKEYGLNSVS